MLSLNVIVSIHIGLFHGSKSTQSQHIISHLVQNMFYKCIKHNVANKIKKFFGQSVFIRKVVEC